MILFFVDDFFWVLLLMGALVRLVTSCEDNKKKNTQLKYLFGLISTKRGVKVIVNQYDFDIFDYIHGTNTDNHCK